jgi:histidine triad (HIT) family protein
MIEKLSRHSIEANPTIFGRIIRGEEPAKIVFEDKDLLAFESIKPLAPVHVVIIPRRHLTSLASIASAEDAALIGKMMLVASKLAESLGIAETGYRVSTNAGKNARQEVPHLHFHLLGGADLGRSCQTDQTRRLEREEAGRQ